MPVQTWVLPVPLGLGGMTLSRRASHLRATGASTVPNAGLDLAVAERLGMAGLHEDSVAPGQIHHEEPDLLLDVRRQYAAQLCELREGCGEAMLEFRARKKMAGSRRARGRQMIRSIQQGLINEGIAVPLTKLCAGFGPPRRMVSCEPTKAAPKVDPRFAEPTEKLIENEASFGYRTDVTAARL